MPRSLACFSFSVLGVQGSEADFCQPPTTLLPLTGLLDRGVHRFPRMCLGLEEKTPTPLLLLICPGIFPKPLLVS